MYIFQHSIKINNNSLIHYFYCSLELERQFFYYKFVKPVSYRN